MARNFMRSYPDPKKDAVHWAASTLRYLGATMTVDKGIWTVYNVHGDEMEAVDWRGLVALAKGAKGNVNLI